MIRLPPRSTRTDTLFPTRRSSDLVGGLFILPRVEIIEQPADHDRGDDHDQDDPEQRPPEQRRLLRAPAFRLIAARFVVAAVFILHMRIAHDCPCSEISRSRTASVLAAMRALKDGMKSGWSSGPPRRRPHELGRASCKERGGQDV